MCWVFPLLVWFYLWAKWRSMQVCYLETHENLGLPFLIESIWNIRFPYRVGGWALGSAQAVRVGVFRVAWGRISDWWVQTIGKSHITVRPARYTCQYVSVLHILRSVVYFCSTCTTVYVLFTHLYNITGTSTLY